MRPCTLPASPPPLPGEQLPLPELQALRTGASVAFAGVELPIGRPWRLQVGSPRALGRACNAWGRNMVAATTLLAAVPWAS